MDVVYSPKDSFYYYYLYCQAQFKLAILTEIELRLGKLKKVKIASLKGNLSQKK